MALPRLSSSESDYRIGEVCAGSGGVLTKRARLTHAGALRTFRYMGVGCVTGAVACGALSLCLMPRPVVPLTATLSIAVCALCGVVSGFAVHALKSALREGPALRRAVRDGNLQEVERLCESGVWIDVPDELGRTALMHAVLGGHKKIAGALLDRGADVNHVDLDGATPLFLASRCAGKQGFSEMVRMLIERGADCNQALVHAVRTRYFSVVEDLIGCGGDPDYVDCDGWPLLAVAAKSRGGHVAQLLIKGGADLGRAIGHVLLRDGKVADELVECKQAEYARDPVLAALRTAIRDGRADIVKVLMDRYNADVGQSWPDGRTLLSYTIELPGVESRPGRLEIVEMLLARGVDPDPVGGEGFTPLFTAASRGYSRIVKVLIAHGAVVDRACGKEDITPFMIAVGNHHLEVVRELAGDPRRGFAILDRTDCEGDTALMRYVKQDDTDVGIVRELCKCGVGVFRVGSMGCTPLIVAVKRQKGLALVRELLYKSRHMVNRRDSSGNTSLSIAACNGDLEVVKELIKCDADLEVRNRFGETPLMRAASRNRLEVVRELLKHRPSLDVVDCLGRAAIHFASASWEGADLHIVQALLKSGADPNLPDNEGCTPLMRVCRHYSPGSDCLDIVKELIAHGANTDLPDREGKTVFDLCVEDAHSQILPVLERARETKKGGCNVSSSQ
ncbi:MAG: ankyrin repeat domain-containing protein [Simkaniaceae bacterium]|nr:ankyrin repeat domain-containing protein [Simkaniaceae bacterium]